MGESPEDNRSSKWEMNIAEIRNTVLPAVKLTFAVGCCMCVEHIEGY